MVHKWKRITNIDFSQLFGFENVADELSGALDFRSDTVEAKLGAKVGGETLVALDVPDAVAQSSLAKSRR